MSPAAPGLFSNAPFGTYFEVELTFIALLLEEVIKYSISPKKWTNSQAKIGTHSVDPLTTIGVPLNLARELLSLSSKR